MSTDAFFIGYELSQLSLMLDLEKNCPETCLLFSGFGCLNPSGLVNSCSAPTFHWLVTNLCHFYTGTKEPLSMFLRSWFTVLPSKQGGAMFLFNWERLMHAPWVLGEPTWACVTQPSNSLELRGREWEERSTHGTQMLVELGRSQVHPSSWLRREFKVNFPATVLAVGVSLLHSFTFFFLLCECMTELTVWLLSWWYAH